MASVINLIKSVLITWGNWRVKLKGGQVRLKKHRTRINKSRGLYNIIYKLYKLYKLYYCQNVRIDKGGQYKAM